MFTFDFEKALQAAGVLLEYQAGRRMGCMRLLKLLYIADREMVRQTGRPITRDRVVAMKHGPVLSRVYDLIRGQSSRAGEWGEYAHTDGYQVELVKDPGRGKLSKGEIAKLLEVSERHRSVGDWELVEATHEFEEWKKHFPGQGRSEGIPWEDVMAAVGRAGWVEGVKQEEEGRRYSNQLLGG